MLRKRKHSRMHPKGNWPFKAKDYRRIFPKPTPTPICQTIAGMALNSALREVAVRGSDVPDRQYDLVDHRTAGNAKASRNLKPTSLKRLVSAVASYTPSTVVSNCPVNVRGISLRSSQAMRPMPCRAICLDTHTGADNDGTEPYRIGALRS